MQFLTPDVIIAIIALIGTLFSSPLHEWVKSKQKKKTTKDPVKQAIDVAAKIDDKLNTIRMNLNADKAWILQFHNGSGLYPTGKSFSKFSMLYESVEIGIDTTRLIYKDVPVVAYYKFIEGVYKDRYISIDDITNPLLTEHYDLLSSATLHGFKGFHAFGIFNLDDKMIGIMGFEYHRVPQMLDDLQINTLISEAGIIGGVLMTYLSSK